MKVELELSDEQVGAIIDGMLAKAGNLQTRGLTYEQAADLLNVSPATVRRRVDAGIIPTIPNISPQRIPSNFIDRLLNTKPVDD